MADRSKAFNVQRPRVSNASTSRVGGASTSRSARPDQRATTSTDRRRNNGAQDEEDDDDDREEDEEKTTIPAALLTRILHEFFAQESTRMSAEASKAAAKYMDIFVREAIARARFGHTGGSGGGLRGDKFLEVEDLEKLAPQLLLDF